MPRAWVIRPQSKAYYRLSDVFSSQPHDDVAEWIEQHIGAFPAPRDGLAENMRVTDARIGKGKLDAVTRRDYRKQPRIIDAVRYELDDNPNIDLFEPMPELLQQQELV